MSTEIWHIDNDLCRCCHAEGNFDNLGIPQTNLKRVEIYIDMLKDCLNIEILPVPGELCLMTYKICKACIKKLRSAINFRKQVKQCEEKFLDMFQRKRIKARNSSINLDIKTEEQDNVAVLKDEIEETEEREGSPEIKFDFLVNNESDNEMHKDGVSFTENGSPIHNLKMHQLSYTDQETSDDDISLSLTSEMKKRKGEKQLKETKTTDKKIDKKDKTKRLKNSSANIDVKIEERANNIIVLKFEEVEEVIRRDSDGNNDSDNEINKVTPLTENSLPNINRNIQEFSFTDEESSDDDFGFSITKQVIKQEGDKVLKKARKLDKNIDKREKTERRITFRLQRKDYRTEGEKFICTHCNKVYDKKQSLSSHVKTKHHINVSFKCRICEKQCMNLAQFTMHKYTEHNIDDRFKCNACKGLFNDKAHLKRHINVYHMLGEKHKCEFCDYESFTLEGMHKHKVKHKNSKDHHCKFCQKAFLRKSTLTLHEKIHTGDRSKVCKVCGKGFVQKSSLNYHMAKYHPEVNF